MKFALILFAGTRYWIIPASPTTTTISAVQQATTAAVICAEGRG